MPGPDQGPEVDPAPAPPLVLELIISPVCRYCGMPAVAAEDGRWVHAEAADAVFCSLIGQTDHPRGRHA